MHALAWLERQPKAAILAAMLLLVVLLGWIDYNTGTEIAFSVFYFLPIAGAAFFVGFRAGILVAAACALNWRLQDADELMHRVAKPRPGHGAASSGPRPRGGS